MKHIVIAIDGTAASGKGTLARRLAALFDFACLDTGKLYRYVGYSILSAGGDLKDEKTVVTAAQAMQLNLRLDFLQDDALSSDEAGQAASVVGQFPQVRQALLDFQRDFAKKPPDGALGAILDGRDIGTVVCPDADLKLYIDADVKIRARRRHKELQSKGISVTYDAVLADMQERDRRDAGRETAPMKPADDALMLDTSVMSIDEVLNQAVSLIKGTLHITPKQ